jgi:hypothetical protein
MTPVVRTENTIKEKIGLRMKIIIGFALTGGVLVAAAAFLHFYPIENIKKQTSNAAQSSPEALVAGKDYEADTLIVKFTESTGIEMVADAQEQLQRIQSERQDMKSLSIQKIEPVFHASSTDAHAEAKRKFGLHRVFRVSLGAGFDISTLARQIGSDAVFEYVTPSYLLEPLTNDPGYGNQWHHEQTQDHDIDTPDAWALTQGSSSVIIADPDSGLAWRHDDLRDNIWQNLGEDANHDGHVIEQVSGQWQFDPGDVNSLDDDGNGYADDFIGMGNAGTGGIGNHGTLTAGLAAARGNNLIGIAGVCWQCRILFAQVTSGNWPNIIEYAVDNGASVINISYGFGSTGCWGEQAGALHDAIRYAYDQDVSIVASSGNDNEYYPPIAPACWNEVLAVANSNQNDRKGSFSTYGGWVDLIAPGTNMYSTYPPNNYFTASGTSYAAPLVAGAAGLIRSLHPNLTNRQVYSILQSSTDPLLEEPLFIGNGRLNAATALQYSDVPVALLDKNPVLVERSDDGLAGSHPIIGTASGGQFTQYELSYGAGVHPTSWVLINESTTQVNNGVLGTFDASGLAAGGYVIRLVVTANEGVTMTDSIYVTVLPTSAPTVSITSPQNNATVSDFVTVAANAADNIAVQRVEFYVDRGQLIGTDTSSPYAVDWKTTHFTNATHTLTAKVFDTSSNSTTSADIRVRVYNKENEPPLLVPAEPDL